MLFNVKSISFASMMFEKGLKQAPSQKLSPPINSDHEVSPVLGRYDCHVNLEAKQIIEMI